MKSLRYLFHTLQTDALAESKMAFLSGPRQVGKTTLARFILETQGQPENYFTWDDSDFRLQWLKNPKQIFQGRRSRETVVLDELHKDRKWKNRLKGLFDLYGDQHSILVTGSARLDYYRKGGDSLQGRYIPYRMHPFSLGENPKIKPPPKIEWTENSFKAFDFDDLLELSGFPEPLLKGSVARARRWRRLYRERLIQQDLRDFRNVRDLQAIENLALLLEDRVGSLLSYESLRQDLNVSFEAVSEWIAVFENLFYLYRIRPYSQKVSRSLKKVPKLYFYDWTTARSDAARFENLVASHLLKAAHFWTDAAFGEFHLYFVRDKQKREVDFLLTKDRKPFLLVETKSKSSTVSPALRHFNDLLKPTFCIQVVHHKKDERPRSRLTSNISFMSAERFLSALP